ncbi:MAG: 23S rRNA (guanosine(2251)-2'-O)-methyltransferase RlmB [Acidobacteria bacterium]|nr:23S rRNA (guanosine(2251)-2'-O)-methyltransferase RlmB [Acidobacteriota bacterium]
MSGRIVGIHAVLAALRAGQRTVTRVVVSAGRRDGRVKEVLEAARAAAVAVHRQPERALDRLADGERHQGVVAFVAGQAYADPAEVLEGAGSPPLFVVLDGVEDPRNLGAVIRAAAAAGADGLFLPEHRAAGLTMSAVRAAAGAAERLPVARVGNIVALIDSLKSRGIWTAGLDPAGETPWSEFDLTLPLALVLGGEGKGLRRLARESCDAVLSIPLDRGVQSLNLAVAAGVVLFETVRQRRSQRGSAPAARRGSPPAGGPPNAGR